MKASLTSRKDHVRDIVIACTKLAKTQVKEHRLNVGIMKGKRQVKLIQPIYQLCHNRISHKALSVANEMLKEARLTPELPPCTGTYHASLGIPCRHTMQRHMQTGEPLDPREFHLH